MDIKNNENSIFEKVQEKPILIKLKNQKLNEIQDTKEKNISEKKSKFSERDLHQLLVNFIYFNPNFNVRSKTIFHENSKKSTKGYDKWLYPDIVGVNFKYEIYNDNILNFVEKFDKIPLKIYSFEIKKELNIANCREYYFQAVSNSSWANEGYLVALDVDESDDALFELLQKLNVSFRIGILSLNSENLAQSKVLISAKQKDRLDLNMMNELSSKNPEFKNFLKTIRDFDIKNSSRFEREFDTVLSEIKIEEYINEKKIRNRG